MNEYDLPKDEQQLLEDIENNAFDPVADFPVRKTQVESYARNTLNKTRNINYSFKGTGCPPAKDPRC